MVYTEFKGWKDMLELMGYPPILRGFLLLCISGFTFPLGGVLILRMNLLPLRFVMMHGVLLGGAIALTMGLNAPVMSLAVNLVLILVLNFSSGLLKIEYGQLSMFLMITTVGLASMIMSVFNVPAKDTLVLLWGSLYTNSWLAVIAALVLGMLLVILISVYFRQISALFHDRDIASSLGIRVKLFELVIMLIIALVVASAMQLMGALLLDAVILLPVVIAAAMARGLKRLFLYSSLLGGGFALVGFFLSLVFDIPVSAGVSLTAGVVFIVIMIIKRGSFNEKRI